jgi:hypothetical protein
MTLTPKCATQPPCCWVEGAESPIIQRSGRQSCVPLASGVLGVALGLLNTLMAEVVSSPRNMPECSAACVEVGTATLATMLRRSFAFCRLPS